MLFSHERKLKRSVDLSPDTDVNLDRFRELAAGEGALPSRGAAIDAIVNTVLSLSSSDAAAMCQAARRALSAAEARIDATDRNDELAYRDATSSVKRFGGLVELFGILAGGITTSQPMRSIRMEGKRVLIPDSEDWIVINEKDAPRSTQATIVEIKNGARFGAPHFVYFDRGTARAAEIDEAILEVYPAYSEILSARVQPAYDAHGRIINLEEYAEAPLPGYFCAAPHDPEMGDPYGVHIIPNRGRKGGED